VVGEKITRVFSEPVRIKLDSSGINILGQKWGEKILVEPESGSFCLINGRRYRGSILIRKKEERILEVVNQLSLEEYLYGVLKWEISPEWPLSTLCAQAIVARTYAFKKLKDNELFYYHLTGLTEDQVYGGVEAEDVRIRIAIDLTRGEILTYQGQPIESFYHACSGGYVTSSQAVWGKDYPYLKTQKDHFSYNSPYYRWMVRIPEEQLEKMLKKGGLQVEEVRGIKVVNRDKSGRVKTLIVEHRGGSEFLLGTELRRIIGFDLLRSTLFEVKKRKGVFMFSGRGWGHGVGMSQWGAKKMGEMGYTTEEILQFYYPETRIQKVY